MIRCGNCSTRARQVAHESVDAVRECFAATYEGDAQQRAELLAEQAAERYWEEGTPAQHAAYQGELEMEQRALRGW